mmetsp:Transcript_100357/g.178376  ORF Transcript_100357/g.178376 Transcript_100357/m.178376 type:complete len:86 (-) Transcript_100357:78-335(-)
MSAPHSSPSIEANAAGINTISGGRANIRINALACPIDPNEAWVGIRVPNGALEILTGPCSAASTTDYRGILRGNMDFCRNCQIQE